MSALLTETVAAPPSDTPVHALRRIDIDDVRESYRVEGIKPSFDVLVMVSGDRVAWACPVYALAVHRSYKSAVGLLAISRNGRDPGGCVALGQLLGLDPDYIRGHVAGWAGEVPDWDTEAERVGWRDGSACHAALIADR